MLLTIGSAAVVLLALLSLTSDSIFLQGFESIERDHTDRDARRASDAVGVMIESLHTKCYDWAAWDDAWHFMQSGNPEFARENLLDMTLVDMQLSAVAFVDMQGVVKLAKGCDLQTESAQPVAAELLELLKPGSTLTQFSTLESSTSGIVMLSEGPMLISVRPITRTDHTGPITGVLLFGQALDAQQIAQLGEHLHMPVSCMSYIDAMADDGWRDAATDVAGRLDRRQSSSTVRVISDQTVSGFALLHDVYDRPGLILRVDLPRTIWAEGQRSASYAIRAVAGLGMVFAMLTLALLDVSVLRRLAHLCREMSGMAKAGGLSGRVTAGGNDEIGDVSKSVNTMLAELQEMDRANVVRDEERRKLALVASRTDNAVIITNARGRIEWVNDGFVRLTGHLPDEVIGEKPGDLLHGEDTDPATIAVMRKALEREEGFSVELINYSRSKRAYWAAVDVQPVCDESGKLANYIAVIKDVSSRRAAEETARESAHRLQSLVANIPGVVYHYDCGAAWRVTFLSEAIREMSGWRAAEFLPGGGRTLHELIDPRDANAVALAIEGAALRGEPYEIEYRMRRADGTLFWVFDRGRPGHADDGRLVCLDGVLFDINDRKEKGDRVEKRERPSCNAA